MMEDSEVGKTCLINCYINKVFDITDSTTVACYKFYILDSPDGKVKTEQQIQNTSEQEACRSLALFQRYRCYSACI